MGKMRQVFGRARARKLLVIAPGCFDVALFTIEVETR